MRQKKKSAKRGQGADTLRILILMLIVAIILIMFANKIVKNLGDRKSTRLNSSHYS